MTKVINMQTSKTQRLGASLLLNGQLRLFTGFVAGFISAFVLLIYVYDVQNKSYRQSSTFPVTAMSLPNTFEPETLGAYLQREVRILCMVLTCPDYLERYAQHVHDTWGQHCTKLVFVSSEDYAPLGVVQVVEPGGDTYEDLWNKTREGFRHVYEMYGEQYDWFLKADDDTYVILDNLRYMLSAYEAEMPIYFGYKMVRYNVSYMSGGASYILSRKALRLFMTKAYSSEKICPEAKKNSIEDFYMGICLQNVGVHLIDAKYALKQDRKAKLFPLNLSSYMYNVNNTIPDWLLLMSSSSIETGLSCCSNYSIAFHYTTPDRMYLYEFLIYKLRLFGAKSPPESLPPRVTQKHLEELFPLEQNLAIRDLTQMPQKPENF